MVDYFRNFNRAILLIILSDLFTWGLYAVLSTLTGLYLAQKIPNDVVEVIGLGIFIYFITRAAVNLPLGKILDSLPGNQDEAAALLIGSFLMGLPFLFYPLITNPFVYYVLQIIFGIGASLHLTSARKIFATSLDKDHEAEEYAMYDIMMCLFIALAGLIGGIIANINGMFFNYVFIAFGILIISSGIWSVVFLKTYYPERPPLSKILVGFFITSTKFVLRRK